MSRWLREEHRPDVGLTSPSAEELARQATIDRWRNVLLRLQFDPSAHDLARFEDDGGAIDRSAS